MSKKPDSHRHLGGSTLAQVEDLIARTPDHGLVRPAKVARIRKSCLDPFKNDILEKKGKGWSDDRIANHLSILHGIKKVNRATVMRRIDFYLGG